jgi:hypothetical protein
VWPDRALPQCFQCLAATAGSSGLHRSQCAFGRSQRQLYDVLAACCDCRGIDRYPRCTRPRAGPSGTEVLRLLVHMQTAHTHAHASIFSTSSARTRDCIALVLPPSALAPRLPERACCSAPSGELMHALLMQHIACIRKRKGMRWVATSPRHNTHTHKVCAKSHTHTGRVAPSHLTSSTRTRASMRTLSAAAAACLCTVSPLLPCRCRCCSRTQGTGLETHWSTQ